MQNTVSLSNFMNFIRPFCSLGNSHSYNTPPTPQMYSTSRRIDLINVPNTNFLACLSILRFLFSFRFASPLFPSLPVRSIGSVFSYCDRASNSEPLVYHSNFLQNCREACSVLFCPSCLIIAFRCVLYTHVQLSVVLRDLVLSFLWCSTLLTSSIFQFFFGLILAVCLFLICPGRFALVRVQINGYMPGFLAAVAADEILVWIVLSPYS